MKGPRPLVEGSMIATEPLVLGVIRCRDLEHLGVVAAFASRRRPVGGPAAWFNMSLSIGDDEDRVRANRGALLEYLGLAGHRVATVRQRPLGPVLRVDSPNAAACASQEGAGMVTDDPQLALLIGSADCVPVLLADPHTPCVGALHVGWRELAAGVVEQGVAALAELGGRPQRTQAWLGPAICGSCYPVGDDVRWLVGGRYPAAFSVGRSGEPALDLSAGIRQALSNLGLNRVFVAGVCTYEYPEDWFSRRRDGRTGVQGSCIALRT